MQDVTNVARHSLILVSLLRVIIQQLRSSLTWKTASCGSDFFSERSLRSFYNLDSSLFTLSSTCVIAVTHRTKLHGDKTLPHIWLRFASNTVCT